MLGFGRLAADLSHPYKTVTDDRVRAFARWFWTELSRDGVVVCARRDLGADLRPPPLDPGRDRHLFLLPEDLLPAPRPRACPPILAPVSADRPLRVVLFNEFPAGTPAFDAWMAGMLARYDFLRVFTYPVSSVERKIGPTWDEVYVVYEFVPRLPTPAALTAIPAADSAKC